MEWIVWITWWIIFCIRYSRSFWLYHQKYEAATNNPSIMIYLNKIENRIMSKIKTGYCLELLTPQTTNCLEALKVR